MRRKKAKLQVELQGLAGFATLPVSLGLCRSQVEGRTIERVFLMVLGLGFDAEVIRRFGAGRLTRYGWFAYVLGALSEILNLKSHKLTGEVDGIPFYSEAIFFGTAIGRYFGKGLAVAPGASPLHSRFELLLAGPASRLRLLSLVLRAYRGAHVRDSRIRTLPATRVVLQAHPSVRTEADGELLGWTPLDIRILPGAFPFAAIGC